MFKVFAKKEFDPLWHEFQDIVLTMDIPIGRRDDLRWIDRNLPFKNQNHPQFERAKELLNFFLKNEDL